MNDTYLLFSLIPTKLYEGLTILMKGIGLFTKVKQGVLKEDLIIFDLNI